MPSKLFETLVEGRGFPTGFPGVSNLWYTHEQVPPAMVTDKTTAPAAHQNIITQPRIRSTLPAPTNTSSKPVKHG